MCTKGSDKCGRHAPSVNNLVELGEMEPAVAASHEKGSALPLSAEPGQELNSSSTLIAVLVERLCQLCGSIPFVYGTSQDTNRQLCRDRQHPSQCCAIFRPRSCDRTAQLSALATLTCSKHSPPSNRVLTCASVNTCLRVRLRMR